MKYEVKLSLKECESIVSLMKYDSVINLSMSHRINEHFGATGYRYEDGDDCPIVFIFESPEKAMYLMLLTEA